MASTQKDILENILSELGTMKKKLPNGELKRMEQNFQEMKDFQHELKEDFSDIKYTLLNPENGVIVRVNKNTAFRRDSETTPEELLELKLELSKLQDWKSGVVKALWVLFSGLIGVLGWIFSEAMSKF
jgi:hypothetical protein|tara:strand:+ start:1588 stop:1971 length:384 start_codon:yes stop_codon:yes gene_type:complete